jgi:rhomboid protease GluP
VTSLFYRIKKFIGNIRVTLILSCIYLIVFLANLSIGNDVVFNALSGSGFHNLNGQFYRVFTASFLHGSWLHLTANIAAFICVGMFIEKRLGHLKYMAVFLVSDILASIMFYTYFSDCSNGNGSSIAIYAMFAVLLILWLESPHAFSYSWYHPGLIYIIIYFVSASFFSGNYTTIIMHSFGFFAGLVIGLLGKQSKILSVKDTII